MEHRSGTTQDASQRERHDWQGSGTDADHQAAVVLDRHGRVLSCGEAAARLLGTSEAALMGRRISDFVCGLFPVGSSPSYSARYMGHLCAADEWRRFTAVDGKGRPFLVDANLAPMASARSAHEMFLLNMRRPG